MSGSKKHKENQIHTDTHQHGDHCHHPHSDAPHHDTDHSHTHHNSKNHSCPSLHEHGVHEHENCGHHHSHSSSHQRHLFSPNELEHLAKESIENLMQQADRYLSEDQFGKVVPLFEVALSKLTQLNSQDSEDILDVINLKQNLAFSYGIIGEHKEALPLWKDVIEFKEKYGTDCSDLLDDYFAVALSCEQCEMKTDFLAYIEKGLKLAKENKFDEYIASFEHELGGFYCDASHFVESEKHLKNAISIRENLHDIVGLAMSKMYMGILFEEQKKYFEAQEFYEKALELTKINEYRDELLQERRELEERLSKIKNANLKNKILNF